MSISAYKKSGVDIDAGNELVDKIKPAIKKTMRSGVLGSVGGFGALFDVKGAGYKDPLLVSATDGVGTKLKIAIDAGKHSTVGQDLVAMCVNDLVVQGAEPLFFLDYFASGKLDVARAQDIIEGIAKGCELAGCALIGGETAEMPGMYADDDYDLAGFAVGAVERDGLIDGSKVQAGDVVIGLPSSGVHSNGFSLVRRIITDICGLTYSDPAPFAEGQTLADCFLAPTRIYTKALAALIKDMPNAVHAMAHITGGGLLENIPRVLPDGLAVQLDAQKWDMPEVFKWLAREGDLTADDLARTFNCGIGMCLIVPSEVAETVMKTLEELGEVALNIGTVVAEGDLAQSDERVQIDHLSF